MKNKILSYISLALKITSLVSGFSAYSGLIPPKYLPISALAFAVVSSTKDFLIHLQTDFSQNE